ncbi:MAG: cell division protein FtsQ/DivIB [Candidatus Omnitrophota bacterium]
MRAKKKRKRFFVFFLFVLPVLAISLSSFAIFKGIKNYITSSSYFIIKKVSIEGIVNTKYADSIQQEILGGNIFCLDTTKISERIQRRFPNFSSVVITRILPSELSIVAKERLPVAVLKRDIYYVFDADGIVLSSFSSKEMMDLPLMTGFEKQLKKVDVGKKYPLKVLQVPLALAKALKIQMPSVYSQVPCAQNLKVTRIDAGDPVNLLFYFNDDIQVKIGNQNFDDRLSLLQVVLKSLDYEMAQVDYIDLRSKEPVVAYKNKNAKKK